MKSGQCDCKEQTSAAQQIDPDIEKYWQLKSLPGLHHYWWRMATEYEIGAYADAFQDWQRGFPVISVRIRKRIPSAPSLAISRPGGRRKKRWQKFLIESVIRE
jgi:hypothetical protein